MLRGGFDLIVWEGSLTSFPAMMMERCVVLQLVEALLDFLKFLDTPLDLDVQR